MTSSSTANQTGGALWRRWGNLSKPRKPINPAVQTRWVDILLEAETVPTAHNMAASAGTWLLLAGYLVFPGTFTSLREASWIHDLEGMGRSGVLMHRAVQNVPLLGLGAVSCVVGTGSCGLLWWRWRSNLLWPTEHIFLPLLIHSTTGLLNTILNVYAARHGTWSVMAIVTAAVTGTYTALAIILFALYRFVLVQQVKNDHQAAVDRMASVPHHSRGICELCRQSSSGSPQPVPPAVTSSGRRQGL